NGWRMAHSTIQLEQLNSVKLLVGLEFHNLVISLVGTSGFIFLPFFQKMRKNYSQTYLVR
ncbi:hypothetical protein, partial [Streptococcus suis]|uniref:hypothetical protein n=1 Tax=Streptococcus suis TaxID=1307 RepID=UPI0037581CD1